MLQVDPGNTNTFDGDKATADVEYEMMDEEYIYLTEDLEWKEGLKEETKEEEFKGDPKDVTKLSEYLFLTKQMGWKKGLKVLEEKSKEAIETESHQIHDMEGFTPKHWHQLTEEERIRALKYLMYLKERRDGKVKGRGCVNERSQRLYTNKIKTSSPTTALTTIMLA